MIGQIGRLAKVAQMGFKSGRILQAGENLAGASKVMAASQTPADAVAATRMGITGKRLVNRAANTLDIGKNYGNYYGLNPDTTNKALEYGHNLGKWTNPVVAPVERIAGGVARVGTAAMSNPIGQLGLFTVAPYALMGAVQGGGEQLPPEAYGQMPGYMPQQMPPEALTGSPTAMMSALDAEQISRAKKRAEEQAALNQFYAQALQQYGDY